MTSKKELKDLSDYMNGFADGWQYTGKDQLNKIAKALREMVVCVCDQGIPGCYAKDCKADHK